MPIPRGVLNSPPMRDVFRVPILRTIVFDASAADAVAIRATRSETVRRTRRRLRGRTTPWEDWTRPALSTAALSRADSDRNAALAFVTWGALLSRDRPRWAAILAGGRWPWRQSEFRSPQRSISERGRTINTTVSQSQACF